MSRTDAPSAEVHVTFFLDIFQKKRREGEDMSLRPAQQETTPAPQKRTAKAQLAASKSPVEGVTASTPAEESSERVEGTPVAAVPPVFVQRDLTAPDGSVRPGWEMWIGDHCFGRADSKELLLASFERLQSPPSSFHWREVRNRMPMRGRPKAAQSEQADAPTPAAKEEAEDSWAWDKKAEEPLVADEPEGFQELTWENPA
jgi:hypothetical protein